VDRKLCGQLIGRLTPYPLRKERVGVAAGFTNHSQCCCLRPCYAPLPASAGGRLLKSRTSVDAESKLRLARPSPSRLSRNETTIQSRPTTASLILVAGPCIRGPAKPVVQPYAGLPSRPGVSQALVSRPAPSLSLVHVPLTKRKKPLGLRILRWQEERHRCSKT
jgi:hypothetical protein